ncbi:hypothetical protein GCM10022254_32630 [Actinomadura meridiana]|uniref:RNA polymerase sigma-70 region 2 domain-containing protein n=1 Tax=Actinomadura meridiana TaxID=559626 RepID=A0ABP8C2T8_9ACTN
MSGWPNLDRADDERLARSLAAGDPSALIQVMDRYAARMYDYCHALLRDQEQAAGALHDALIAAYAHVSLLREPDRFRSWLYALVRNECTRRLRSPRRPTERHEAPEVEDGFLDEAELAQRRETRQFVHGALAGLRGRERESLDLMMRHGLDVVEIGGVLGMNAEAATDLTSEARVRLDDALAAASIARNGRDCPSVSALADDGGWPLPGPTIRKLVHHIETCPTCIARRDRTLSAARLLQVLPVAMMPTDLRGLVMVTATDPSLASDRAGIARRAEPFDTWGWPVIVDSTASLASSGRGASRAVFPVLAAVAAVIVIVAGAYYVMSDSPATSPIAEGTQGDPSLPAPESGLPSGETEVPSQSPTSSKSGSPTPSRSTSSPATPTTPTHRTKAPTPSTSQPQQTGPGTLKVDFSRCRELGPGDTCRFQVRAVGGPVEAWLVSVPPPLYGNSGGMIPNGGTVTAVVTLPTDCDGPDSGSGRVTFLPGEQTADVTWRCPGSGTPNNGEPN